MEALRVCFLVSGEGGTLKFLTKAIQVLNLNFIVDAVIADRTCGALNFAENMNIPNYKCPYNQKRPQALRILLQKIQSDVIITNFHKIIDYETLKSTNKRFVNLHYSLLPSFGGLIGMQTLQAAKEVRARFVGASFHHVTKELDAGELIGQVAIPVNWKFVKEEDLMNTVFQAACILCLNSLMHIVNEQIQEPMAEIFHIQGYPAYFNPGLYYSPEVFKPEFWSDIRNL